LLSKYEEIELVYEFFKSDEITEEEADKEFEKFVNLIEDLELKNMLRNEEDSFDAILTINSGAGGTESNDWASILERMYLRWAEDNNYKLA